MCFTWGPRDGDCVVKLKVAMKLEEGMDVGKVLQVW